MCCFGLGFMLLCNVVSELSSVAQPVLIPKPQAVYTAFAAFLCYLSVIDEHFSSFIT